MQRLTGARRFPNAALACEAAAGGGGVAVTQWVYVEQDVKSGRLVLPFAHHASSDNGWYMVNSKYRSDEKKIADFRAWLGGLVQAERQVLEEKN